MRRRSGESTGSYSKIDKKSVRAILLIVSTLTYILLGAAVFNKLESEEDNRIRSEIEMIREKLHDKYNFSSKDYQLLQTVIVKSLPFKAGYQWRFAGAFYFAVVVITTVGYGHSTPATVWGKLFCMLFALAGIPLGLIMFQSIGERVNTLIAFCLRRLRRTLLTRGINLMPGGVTPTHLLIVSLSIGTMVILTGTYVFHVEERWTLFEAYYYCVITLSTIGFGDYVPLQTDEVLQKAPGYVLYTLFFIIFGLAIFSACVNLLVLGFMAQNADAVTAASRDPPRAIIFETFAPPRSSSITSDFLRKVSNTFSLDSLRPSTSTNRLQRCLTPPLPSSDSGEPASLRSRVFSSLCKSCGLRRREKAPERRVYFAVRRLPTEHIQHLIDNRAGSYL
ncbi:hypothetical protein QR680_017844 [Steinernema hermaphroditum]|uniref:Potassium channel domain-containing protein n=1 Tax=Steinernema hermaphroditum TaxID=289476 RepID=A0AA39LPU8_9BILA|nr:hypothetical protein QR680_017844 [Steinernema hermaphroditum]